MGLPPRYEFESDESTREYKTHDSESDRRISVTGGLDNPADCWGVVIWPLLAEGPFAIGHFWWSSSAAQLLVLKFSLSALRGARILRRSGTGRAVKVPEFSFICANFYL